MADELDDLYALPREEFVAARNALAARLKREGRADEAAAVKKLAKPTVPVAALNRLAHEEPKLVKALLGAGDALRRAQARALSGGKADELRRASAAQHAAVRELLDAAGPLAGPARERVRESLVAASLDPGAGAELARGRLQAELEAPPFPAGLAAAPPGRARSGDQLAERRRAREADRARVAELRSRLRELKQDLAAARREAERAAADAERARFELRRAEGAQDEATERAERLEAEAAELEAALANPDGQARP